MRLMRRQVLASWQGVGSVLGRGASSTSGFALEAAVTRGAPEDGGTGLIPDDRLCDAVFWGCGISE